MTNADTAMLTLGFVRSGIINEFGQPWFYMSPGYFWEEQSNGNRLAKHLQFFDSMVNPDVSNDKKYGFHVRCIFLPSIFSPEAMGWPWGMD